MNRIINADCRDAMRQLIAEGVRVDAIVTDPPYHLTTGKKGESGQASVNLNSPYGRARIGTGFMGMKWDGGGVAFDPETWALALNLLKPGGHLLAFGGTRTYHRLACAIEDAGFEIRDQIGWVYGSGFPKSLDVSKAIDKAAGVDRQDKFEGAFERRAGPTGNKRCDVCGKWLVSGSPCQCPRPQDAAITEAARQWEGWGTALKPAWEPICVARKALEGTVAENVQKHGTGAINVDACRVSTSDSLNGGAYAAHGGRTESPSLRAGSGMNQPGKTAGRKFQQPAGRWPANIVHDGSDEVVALFPQEAGAAAPVFKRGSDKFRNAYGAFAGDIDEQGSTFRGDSGSAARFFYCAKATQAERADSKHPTIKPLALMRWLVRMVVPRGAIVLDPFAGSGTTVEACMLEQMRYIAIEREAEYVADINARVDRIRGTLGLELSA